MGMLDLGALDDTVVVWPNNANFPKPSTMHLEQCQWKVISMLGWAAVVPQMMMGTKNQHVKHTHQMMMVAPWKMRMKSSGCHQKKELGIEKKTEGADEELISLEGNGSCPLKKIANNLKTVCVQCCV